MKKHLFSLLFILVSYVGFSQKGLSYQAVILDPSKIEVPGQDISGQPLVNGDVWLKFSIYNGSSLQFEEVQKTKTDAYGLVNLMIGSVSSASFNSLVWDSSQKTLQVHVSFDQGSSYTKVSDQKLTYSPYTLFAETAGKLGGVLGIAGGGTGATTAADARLNLGLDQVNNTSDATKPVSAATRAALDLKANLSEMAASLGTKADTAYVLTKVAAATIADADASTKGKIQLAGDLAGTAAAPTVPGLALKANAADVTAALALKANSANLTLSLATKADTAYVLTKVAAATIADADATTKGKIQLAGDLGGTASAPTVPDLALKANASDVATSLNLKANISDVNSDLALKASTSDLTAGLALKIDASQKGAANGVATLNASGIIPSSQLPPVTLSSTSVVGSDTEMIALTGAIVGSIAVRTDVNKNYVLSALPASTLGNWVELLTPAAPVQAVNGYTGSVNLTKTDFDLGNVDNTRDANKPISNDTQAALNLKANSSTVDAALAQKLNITDANTALAAKSNASEVNAQLATKISAADAINAINLKLDANKVGALSGVASLDASGKIPTDQIPAISFSSVKVLSSEAEMLALGNAVVGSVVIRTDENKNYVLAANDPSILTNWKQLLTPAPPVQSVNGLTGNVTLTKSLLDLGNVENTSDANKPISSLTQSALNTKADISTIQAALNTKANSLDVTAALALKASSEDLLSLRNTVTANTASTTTNSNDIALKANIASPTFTGTVNASSSLNTGQIVSTSIVTAKSFSSTPKVLYHINTTNNIKWDPSQGLNASVTLERLNSILTFTASGSTPLALTTPPVGSYGTLVVSQDASGSRSITLPTNLTNKILGSNSTTTVTLSTAPNSKDILNFYYDGTTCYWNLGQGYGSASPSSASSVASSASTFTGSISLESEVTGKLSVINGGTGVTSLTSGSLLKGNGTNSILPAIPGSDYQLPLTLTTTGSGAATLSGTTLNIPLVSSFTLPTASSSLLGGVIVGTNLSIDGAGVLSANINAGSISGTVAIANGGTGATTQQAAINALTGTQSTGKYLRSDGTNATLSVIQAADIPTLNQNTTGNATTATTAGNITATTNTTLTSLTNLATIGTITTGTWNASTIEVAKGGTGATTQQAAINALTGTQSTGKYLRSDGTNATLSVIQAADIPTLNQNTTGNATTATTAGNITATTNTTLTSLTNLATIGTITTGTWSASTIEVAKGGTGATTATAALTNLGAAPLASPTFTGTVTTGAINSGALSATSVNTPIYASTPQTLTDAATISWNPALGLNASVTLGGSRTLSFSTAPASGAYGTLVVKQDVTGGRTLTLPSVANKILGSTSTTTIGLSAAANAIDIINFYFDGTNYFWNVGQGYGTAASSSSTASNIAGGTAGSIPYQTAAGATSLLPKGTDGQVLTLASGIPSWAAPTGGSGSGGHYVGEVYGGGIVFYVTTGGYHGLIASSTDIVAIPMVIFDRATSPSYKYSTNSENLYTDWVTPTFSQLNILYSARATTGLNLGSFFYVSSTFGDNDAFSFKGLNFSNNAAGTVNGNWSTNGPEIRGRAIRTF